MLLLEQIIRVIAPHNCLGCGAEEDALLCDACQQSLVTVPSRCYRCKAVTENYAVCKACAPATPLRHVMVYAHHADLVKELIHHAKYERAQSGLREMATLTASLLDDFDDDIVLAYIPTASSRVRMRGYDHALLLARHLGRTRHVGVKRLLMRVGQAHQVGSGRTQRLRQIRGAFRAVHPEQIRGKHIVLVDDVLTSGATLETAARTLKGAGAKRVSAIVFAQA